MDIFKKAIATFGPQAQLSQVEEELIELLDAIKRYQKKKVTKSELTEEIVDVEIMLEQLKLIFRIGPASLERTKEKKLKKLERLCKKAIGENQYL